MNISGIFRATIPVLLLAFVAIAPLALAQQTSVSVSVQQAVQEGKVDVQVYSLGGATGSTIRVDVRRKIPQSVTLEINPGTVFLCQSGRVQNMAGGTIKGEFNGPNTYRPAAINAIVLADDAWHSYLVESFCMDFHKGPPQRGEKFTLAIQDQRAARILQVTKDPKTSLWAFQFALWMDREGISEKEMLSRYGNVGTAADVRVARSLIQQAEQKGIAGIPADMAPDVRKEVEKLFSPDPAVRAAAVRVLVKSGQKAAAAAPFLAANVVTNTPGQVSHSTWVNILANPQSASVAVEQTGMPDFKALVDAMRELKAARQADGKDHPHPLREKIRQKIESVVAPKP